MNLPTQHFFRLHDGPSALLLANCWDCASARLLQSLGAQAVATSSAALAWSNGFPDGERLPFATLLSAVRAIGRVLTVPLSVDLEAGYADEARAVGEHVRALVDEGVVGLNLEDGAGPPKLLCAKLAQAKSAAQHAGVPLFLNARTDVYLRSLGPEASRAEQTLERAAQYRDAGADGLFVPGLVALKVMGELSSKSGLRLNVMACEGLPEKAALEAAGVRRLSLGTALAERTWCATAAAVRPFLEAGRLEHLVPGALTFATLDALF